jgi:hypothetical protein
MLPEIILYSNDTKKHGSKKIVWVDSKEGIDYSEGSETAPVRTLKIAVKKCGDGGVVYCKKGVYSAKRIGGGFSRKYWTTITAAPGLKIGEVKIQGGRPATDFLKFKDVDIFIDVEGDYDMVVGGEGSSKSSRAWFDNCRLYNKKGRNAAETSPFGNKLTAYVTGGLTGLLKNGPINATLIRNHKVRQIVSEAFSGNDMLVVNSSVEDVLPGIDETAKPSLFVGCAITPQWLENIIFYNVTAKSLEGNGIIAGRIRNSAFVNVMIEGTAKNGFSRFTDKVENVYIKNLSQRNLEWDWHLGDIKKAGALKPVNVRAYSLGVKKMYGYTAYDGSCGILVEQEGVVENDVY